MSERLIKVEGNKRNSLLSGYMYYGEYVSVHVVCGIHFLSPPHSIGASISFVM